MLTSGQFQEDLLEAAFLAAQFAHGDSGCHEFGVDAARRLVRLQIQCGAVDPHGVGAEPSAKTGGRVLDRRGDHAQRPSGAQARDGGLGDQPPPRDHADPVADLFHFGQHVARQQHGHRVRGERADQHP
ncbi:MAG TPA: hypothetical protein VG674_02455 [Amycolatopsis sp.]|nr:hypothetical protein [Amycolatopsis sp.]